MPKGAAARSWRSRSEVGPILTEAPAGSQVIGWKIARKSHLDRSRKQGWNSLCFTARKRSAGVDDILWLTPSDFEHTAQLDRHNDQCFPPAMGRLLKELLMDHPSYDIRRDKDGFVLIAKPDHIDEFSDLVREAADHAGEDFVIFTVSDGHQGYSQMFVMPLDDFFSPG